MKKTLASLFIFFIFLFTGMPQETASKEEALNDGDFFYYAEDYTEAIFHYNKLLGSDLLNSNIQFKMGVCYLNIPGQEEKAIPFLKEASTNTTEKYKKRSTKETKAPEYSLFYLGNAYRINNQLDKALDTYQEFLEIPDFENKFNQEMVEKEIRACEKAKIIKDIPVNVSIINLGEPVNSGVSNYRPAISNDGNMIAYMSELKFYNGIFISRKKNGIWSEPENINPQVGSDGDVVPCAISNDKNEIYLVKGEDDNRDIYISRFDGTFWGKMEPLNTNINSVRAESHASISDDNQSLYFSSNKRGGAGEFDIYVSRRNSDGSWGTAENLGPLINTRFSEEYPNICKGILYFSSNAHYNMGGFDVFYSKGEPGNWTNPVNLGYPVNTTGDDICYAPVGNGKEGYIAKILKEGLGKEDIYHILFHEDEESVAGPVEGLIDTKGLKLEFDHSFDIRIMDADGKTQIGTIHFDKESGSLSYRLKNAGLNFDFKEKEQ